MLMEGQAIQKIILGNCINELSNIEENSIDLVVTSPPYNLEVKYDAYDDDLKWNEYWKFIEYIAVELFRVMKSEGRVCINIPSDVSKGENKGKIDFTYKFKEIFYKRGFNYKDKIYWDKQNIKNKRACGSYRRASAPNVLLPFEEIIIFYKYERKLKQKDITMSSEEFESLVYGHWIIKGEKRKEHPAPFPEKLVERIIKLYSYEDALILDPFLGSGTTCVVSKKMNRQYIGIEISPKYYNYAIKRINNVNNTKE